MSATVVSRTLRGSQKKPRSGPDALPPAKKSKLANGYSSLLNGTPSKKPTAKLNGVRNSRKDRVVEATAVVGGPVGSADDVDMPDAEPIVISSAEESSDYASSDEEAAQDEPATTNGEAKETEEGDDEAQDGEEETFGEKLQAHEPSAARAPRVVDVETALSTTDHSHALATTSNNRILSAPSATSLGTVLTQALRTNDKDLLDSCLRVVDVDAIYATVERLPSPLVANLLQKLAERLYKKPGRAGILMVWVQWSLAAHGGYLASQPQLVKQLATLNKVLKERASGLQPLLSLKGRLDMLQAQLELRRRNQKRAANNDEDEAVIYVEGEDDTSASEASGDEDEDVEGGDLDDDEDDSDDMPTTMEVDEDDEADSEDEDLIDDMAEETDDDTGDDLSEPASADDLDGAEEEESEEERAAPMSVRRSTVGRSGARRY
ncbi:NUC189-domain-containing protein [Sporormia fimetaria CBS 119925]|uniref:NUC189-domain-containing protein n=1 Tax=Sporormia fimetaria CBS 119925 TaxID=1340428 RepID=A0A6A6VI72_9PLEO|nr:NUC189-domain-containing protein [Sporormia fimetaria CBS 119925]